MTDRIIDGRPSLPSPEERPALPAPENDLSDRHEQQQEDRPGWRRPMVWLALGILILLAAMAAFCSGGGGGKEGEGPPVASVSAAPVQSLTWEDRLRAVGTVEAVQGGGM